MERSHSEDGAGEAEGPAVSVPMSVTPAGLECPKMRHGMAFAAFVSRFRRWAEAVGATDKVKVVMLEGSLPEEVLCRTGQVFERGYGFEELVDEIGYLVDGPGRGAQLLNEIIESRRTANETVEAFFEKLLGKVRRYFAGTGLSEQGMVQYAVDSVVCKLPDGRVREKLRVKREEMVSAEMVIRRIREAEEVRSLARSDQGREVAAQEELQRLREEVSRLRLRVQPTGRGVEETTTGTIRQQRPPIACFSCGGQGHIARDCPRRRSTGQGPVCYRCEQSGHIARACPLNETARSFPAATEGRQSTEPRRGQFN